MRLLKEILNQDTIWSCKVPSKSKKGVEYLIRFHKDGRITHEPNCEASQFHQGCSHIKLARKKWEQKRLQSEMKTTKWQI